MTLGRVDLSLNLGVEFVHQALRFLVFRYQRFTDHANSLIGPTNLIGVWFGVVILPKVELAGLHNLDAVDAHSHAAIVAGGAR